MIPALALMLLLQASPAPQKAPTPTYAVEPVTRTVAHCPKGWHVERWRAAYCPYCATFGGGEQTIQGHDEGYAPYYAPNPLMADTPMSIQHPDKCVADSGSIATWVDPVAPPDFTVTPCKGDCIGGDRSPFRGYTNCDPTSGEGFCIRPPCDITSLAGDCGYLFQPTEWPVIIGDFHVGPDQPLAKSMADQGWSCTYDEIRIECVAPPKRKTAK